MELFEFDETDRDNPYSHKCTFKIPFKDRAAAEEWATNRSWSGYSYNVLREQEGKRIVSPLDDQALILGELSIDDFQLLCTRLDQLVTINDDLGWSTNIGGHQVDFALVSMETVQITVGTELIDQPIEKFYLKLVGYASFNDLKPMFRKVKERKSVVFMRTLIDVPTWTNWLALDSTGKVHAFEVRPRYVDVKRKWVKNPHPGCKNRKKKVGTFTNISMVEVESSIHSLNGGN